MSTESTHIRLTLPVGCAVASVGEWHIVQYTTAAGSDWAAFNRFTGEQMTAEERAALEAPEPEAGPELLDKAGRPFTTEPTPLAKAGRTMIELMRNGS